MDSPTGNVSPRPSVLPWATAIHLLSVVAITLAMTAYTHNIDDIKTLFFYFTGPVLMLIGAAVFAIGEAPRPNRWIVAGLTAYLWVLIVSTLFSRYAYAGWNQFLWTWSAFGFFISAMAIGSSARHGEMLLRGLVVLILVVNLVGFFMYDFVGGGHSGIGWLTQQLYGPQAPTDVTSLYRLLRTLSSAAGNMQSTILSRDFYASVCLFYLPLAMFLAVRLDPRRFSAWRAIGFVASLTITTTIFLCFSRFHYPIWLLSVVFFSAAFFVIGTGRQRAWLIALVILMFACGAVATFLKYSELMNALNLKYLSSKTLATIWAAAWSIFTRHPILGGGPGTFGIYFPDFRDPNYSQYGISHVTTYAHNQYLDLLSETGLLGFAAFIVLLFGIMAPIARGTIARSDLHERGRLLTGLIAVTTILFVIFFGPIGRWVSGAVPMWTILGLAAGWALQQSPAASAQPALPPQRLLAFAPIALGLMLLPLGFLQGLQVYRADLPYAEGLSYMEPAMEAMDNKSASIKPEEVERLLKQSAPSFEKSMQIAPYFYSPYYKLGSVYMTLSTTERSKAEKFRSEHNALEAQKHDLQADDYLLKSKNVYERLAAINPHYAQLDYNLGIVYQAYLDESRREAETLAGNAKLQKQGEASIFRGLAEKSLANSCRVSNTKDAVLGYGNFLLNDGNLADALRVFQSASDRDPEDPDLAEGYLKAARKAGDTAAIAKASVRLKAIKPQSELLKP